MSRIECRIRAYHLIYTIRNDQQNLNFNIKRLHLIIEQSKTEIVVDSLDTLLYTHYDHPLPQE